VKPRIRTFVFLFALALMAAAPSSATAATGCPTLTNLPSTALASLDTTNPSAAWQQGSPVGTVDVAMSGDALVVDRMEYAINCGTPVTVLGHTGTAPVTGEGAWRFTHRVHDSVTDTWTAWDDDYISIDSLQPTNTTTPPTTNWQKGPTVTVPLTAAPDSGSPVHMEWQVDGGGWAPGVTASMSGTGTYLLDTRAVDEAGNVHERIGDTVRIDATLPSDDTITPDPNVWQNGPVDVVITGSDADSGVDRVEWQLDSGPLQYSNSSAFQITIGTHGEHTLRTRVIDEAGNPSPWTDRIVKVDIQGPADTTVIPTGWVTDPSTVINITADDNDASGIKSIEWELDDTTSGSALGVDSTPVTVTGDGVHKLEVRIVDNMDRVNDWHTHLVKIDTVNPVDHTTVAAGWLPLGHLDVLVRGADTHSQVQGVEWRLDNGDILNASANNHEVRVAGNGVHVLETRIVDNAGRRSGWTVHTINLDAGLPTNTTPLAPTGWRNTPYSVVLNGTDGLSGVASVNHTIQLDGEPEGAEHEGTRNVTRVELEDDGEHVLRTRVKDNAGNYSAWRAETIRIDRVVPTDATVYPSAPVGNRHIVTFNPTDDRSGVAGVEWKLEDGVVKTTPTARITGEGEHTLSVRVQDLAGNWSAWTHHQITVVLGLDTIAPTDETVIPAAWQLVAYTVTVKAVDDEDGKGIDHVQWRYGDNKTGQGASGSQFTITEDGEHEIETRAIDKAGNASPWKRQTLRLDTTQPTETTVMPGRWTNQNTFTLRATDATSGLANLEYKIDNGAPISAADGTTVTLPGDGTYRISHRALDNAGQSSGWKIDEFTIDTVAPVNTSAAAPTLWLRTALALPLTGTDNASGVDRAEWRVSGGSTQTGSTTAVTTEGTQTLETRIVDKAGNVSAWRSETIRIDRTKPVNTTPHPAAPWTRTSYTTTVTGTDASPGSGVARVEHKLDSGSPVASAGVSITTEGRHKLYTRVVDNAGNESDWREDTIGIDKTVPTLSVDCGQASWRNTPATCAVTAEGGLSGLPTLTVTRAGGVAEPIAGSYTVESDGASKLTFRAVDGAGNEKTATTEVKVDRTPPAATVSCTPASGTGWTCKAAGSDALSGVATVKYSVDGSAPAAAGGAFSVQKGTVVVSVTDQAGNTGVSSPLQLADRTPAPPTETDDEPTARSTSKAVLLRKRSAGASRLLGQLGLSATPTRTTVELRPLALGKGTFRFVIKVKTGKKTKTFTKTQRTRKGYSAKMSFRGPAAATASVKLTVAKKSGRRWVAYAGATARLKG
jgi:hypothetical protein